MAPSKGSSSKVRIIGGRWRGSLLPVVNADGLRPSADRNRETLFNWLQGRLTGARCLDLFAGTGVLGLEALSRGASSCTLLESNAQVHAALQESINRFQADGAELLRTDALLWLKQTPATAFDIVFVDPPFGTPLAREACAQLDQPGRLTPDARVYVEQGIKEPDCWPHNWQILREGRSREVRYVLLDPQRP